MNRFRRKIALRREHRERYGSYFVRCRLANALLLRMMYSDHPTQDWHAHEHAAAVVGSSAYIRRRAVLKEAWKEYKRQTIDVQLEIAKAAFLARAHARHNKVH